MTKQTTRQRPTVSEEIKTLLFFLGRDTRELRGPRLRLQSCRVNAVSLTLPDEVPTRAAVEVETFDYDIKEWAARGYVYRLLYPTRREYEVGLSEAGLTILRMLEESAHG